MRSAFPLLVALLLALPWLPQGEIGAVNDRAIESIEIERALFTPQPPAVAKLPRVYDRIATQRIDERTIAVYSHDFLILTIKLK